MPLQLPQRVLTVEATRCGTASMASATTVAAPRPKRGGSIAPSHYWGRRSVPYANRREALRCSFPPRSAATLFFRLHRHCWGCRLVAPDDLVVVAAELSLLRRVCLSSSSPRLDCASLHLLPVSTMPFRRRGCSCAAFALSRVRSRDDWLPPKQLNTTAAARGVTPRPLNTIE